MYIIDLNFSTINNLKINDCNCVGDNGGSLYMQKIYSSIIKNTEINNSKSVTPKQAYYSSIFSEKPENLTKLQKLMNDFKESNNLAVFGNENPVVARFVLKKL